MLFYQKTSLKCLLISKILLLFLLVAGCTPMIDNRGNFPDDLKLKQLELGKSTTFDVEYLFGSPSSRSVFGDNIWYYISSKQKRFAFYRPTELERRVLAITFNDTGVVSEMKFFDVDDAIDVNFAKKETKTYGHSMGILEQLIGNLGRFEGAD